MPLRCFTADAYNATVQQHQQRHQEQQEQQPKQQQARRGASQGRRQQQQQQPFPDGELPQAQPDGCALHADGHAHTRLRLSANTCCAVHDPEVQQHLTALLQLLHVDTSTGSLADQLQVRAVACMAGCVPKMGRRGPRFPHKLLSLTAGCGVPAGCQGGAA